MKNTSIATSIRLPSGVDSLINKISENSKISKSTFMRKAILEKIEDELDIMKAENILSKNERTYSLEEVKNALKMAD